MVSWRETNHHVELLVLGDVVRPALLEVADGVGEYLLG